VCGGEGGGGLRVDLVAVSEWGGRRRSGGEGGSIVHTSAVVAVVETANKKMKRSGRDSGVEDIFANRNKLKTQAAGGGGGIPEVLIWRGAACSEEVLLEYLNTLFLQPVMALSCADLIQGL
jgi:hypothetical protein